MRLRTLALVTAMLVPALAAAERPKLALVPLTAQRVPEDVVGVLNDLLATSVSQLNTFDVITPADISAMLGMERMKDALGCTDVSCSVELGGALGADRLLTGTVSLLGDEIIVQLRVIDTKKQSVTTRAQAKAKNDERVLAPAVDEAVLQLFDIDSELWDSYKRYVAAARGSAFLPWDIERWRGLAGAEREEWLDYLSYRQKARAASGEVLDKDTWLADVKLGRAEVESTPEGATVTLGDESVGTTPLVIKGRRKGTYRLHLTLAGHRAEERDVTIDDGKTAKVRVTLQSEESVAAAVDERSFKTAVLIGAGAATAILAGAGLFMIASAGSADSEYGSFERASTPELAVARYEGVKDAVDAHNRKVLIGKLGLGAAALTGAVAMWAYTTRPELVVGAGLSPGGGAMITVGGSL